MRAIVPVINMIGLGYMHVHNLIRVLRAIIARTVEVVVQVFGRGHADDGEDEVDSQNDELDHP